MFPERDPKYFGVSELTLIDSAGSHDAGSPAHVGEAGYGSGRYACMALSLKVTRVLCVGASEFR